MAEPRKSPSFAGFASRRFYGSVPLFEKDGVAMISRLHGVVCEIDGESLVVDVHGVGYAVSASRALAARCQLGDSVTFPVYTDVKEDSIRLFGFDTKGEREVFLLLNRVSGMGPRSSMDVVSNVAIRDLLRAIGAGDVHSLMKIKGVGKKKAERIVVELRDLVAAMAGERSSSLREMVTIHRTGDGGGEPPSFTLDGDAVSALEVLGFSNKDAEAAVTKAWASLGQNEALESATGSPVREVGDLVREALKHV